MKKKIIVLLMTMTMVAGAFAGCGADSSNVTDNKKTEATDKSDSTDKTDSLKEDSQKDSQEENPFLGPNGLMFASEDDVVVNISGVDVPLTLTRDELIALIEENNWEIEYGSGKRKPIRSFKTSDGRVRVNVHDSKRDGSGEELMSMDFLPDYMDYIELSKVSINGVTLDKVETLKNDSNTIEDKENGYFMISIADYTTIAADYNSEGKLMVIHLTREEYSLR